MGQRRGSGGIWVPIFIIVGLALIGLAMAAPSLDVDLDVASRIFIFGAGVVLLVLAAIVALVTKLYVKTSADQAFVRTGMGGTHPIIDGGAIVFPVVHEI